MKSPKFLALTFTLFLTIVSQGLGQESQINWEFDVEAALQKSKAENKVVLIHFSADWCRPCRHLDTFVFTSPIVFDAFNTNVIPVKIDVDEHPDLVREYGVAGVPTDVVITPAGRTILRRTSPKTTTDYVRLIKSLDRIQEHKTSDTPSVAKQIQELKEQLEPKTAPIAQDENFRPSAPMHTAPKITTNGKQLARGKARFLANPYFDVNKKKDVQASIQIINDPLNNEDNRFAATEPKAKVARAPQPQVQRNTTFEVPETPMLVPQKNATDLADLERQFVEETIQQAKMEARELEQQHLAKQRLADEKQKFTDQQRLAEQERLAKREQLSEQTKAAEEKLRLAKQQRIIEEKRLADAKREAEQLRLADQRRQAEAKQKAEERRLAEQQRLAEERRLEAERRLAKQREEVEQLRIAEQRAIQMQRTAERIAEEKIAAFKKSEEQLRADQRTAELSKIKEATREMVAEQFAQKEQEEQQRLAEQRAQQEKALAMRQKAEAEKAVAELQDRSQFALLGKCPVTLMTESKWVDGDKAFGCVHRGRTYLFSSQLHLKEFQAAPDKYSPLLAGYDPVVYHEEGRLELGKEENGVFMGKLPNQRIVLFKDAETRAKFQSNPAEFIETVRQAMMPPTPTAQDSKMR